MKQALLREMRVNLKRTEWVLEGLPDDEWMKPVPGLQKTPKDLIIHILNSRWVQCEFAKMGKIDRALFKVHFKRLLVMSPLELRNEHLKMGSEITGWLEKVESHDLELTFESYGGHLESKSTFVMGIITHEYHHRGQLILYFRLLGIEPPKIYGL